jgi:hypothetical protein
MAASANYSFYDKPYQVNVRKYRPPVSTVYPKNMYEDKLRAGMGATRGETRAKQDVVRHRWLDSMTSADQKHVFLMNAARMGVDQRNYRNRWRLSN